MASALGFVVRVRGCVAGVIGFVIGVQGFVSGLRGFVSDGDIRAGGFVIRVRCFVQNLRTPIPQNNVFLQKHRNLSFQL